MRIAIVSDAWRPQVNGVVRALVATVDQLRAMGHEVMTVTPSHFRTFPCPRYPEIRLALWPRRSVRRMLGRFAPDAVHIATEGPLGWAARGWCKSQARPFTSSFHTRFPDYVALRTAYREAGGKGAWMVNNGYDQAMAENAVRHGDDLVAFGKLYIANPDLVARLKQGGPFNQGNQKTWYGGGSVGYTDYPPL